MFLASTSRLGLRTISGSLGAVSLSQNHFDLLQKHQTQNHNRSISFNRTFQSLSSRSLLNCGDSSSTTWLLSKSCLPSLSVRPMSGSLAEDILRAKQEEEKKQEHKDQDKDGGQQKKGPKPLTKWQKIGYITFGVLFTGSLVSNAILFCKFKSSLS